MSASTVALSQTIKKVANSTWKPTKRKITYKPLQVYHEPEDFDWESNEDFSDISDDGAWSESTLGLMGK